MIYAHLAHKLATESVDDASDRGSLALADEIKVEHALGGLGLQAVDEASRLGVEQSVLGSRAERSARGTEAGNVVVCRLGGGGDRGHDERQVW